MAAVSEYSELAIQNDAVTLNERLIKSLVRQHELTQAAEQLNEHLQEEIGARKRAEEALINSEKLASVGRMAAVLAHEINNPLESVTNLLFIAGTAEGVPTEVRHYLEVADGELRRIAHITRQTLGFYRETAAPATFAVVKLFESIVDLLQAKIVSARATVHVQCDVGLQITAFQGELRQVFSNLLRNSLDAIPEGGTIRLRASRTSSARDGRCAVRISVADDGHGISASALPKIFEPFFTTKGLVGNGLGLWVSKQIVDKHGGIMQVRSHTRGVFQGTTFSVVLLVNKTSHDRARNIATVTEV
ncbi:MAG: sensor histidine kinase [Janthinobacterium lividum]